MYVPCEFLCQLVTLLVLYREGSVRGYGMRVSQSSPGSDSWVDDPITRHIIGLYIDKEQEGDKNLLWPLILHVRGPFVILVLPLVEPRHVKEYAKLCKTSDCGHAVGADHSLSSILLDLPSITGYGKLHIAITLRNCTIPDDDTLRFKCSFVCYL